MFLYHNTHSHTTLKKLKKKTSIFLDLVTPADLIEVASKIKCKRSLDNNNISSTLMNTSIQNTVVPLTHIINLSLATGVVPQNMKIGKVIPIFKSGDRTLLTNDRPMSILSVYFKILEWQIFQENDKPKKHITISLFLDLSKAFDTISNEILIKKIDNIGIPSVAQLWFKSYLSDRKQFMEIFIPNLHQRH